jgi:molybdopterin molybdotransferase
VITTGGELVTPGQDPSAAQIRDSNGPMLTAMAVAIGLAPPRTLHADDRLAAIRAALDCVADRDIVLLAGGVSVGTYDLVPQALRQYGAEVVFHKVTQKPGKPLLFTRRGSQLLFGLPGNPLACHLCFHRYVAAAARQLAGRPAQSLPLVGRLTAAVKGPRLRTFYATARAEPDEAAYGGWLVHPNPGVSSADIFSTCRANCYVEVPPRSEGMPVGSPVSFTWVIGSP